MDYTSGSFTDEQFLEACAELQQPALAGADWQLLLETLGISVYRLLDQVAAACWRTAGLQRPEAHLPVGRERLQPRKLVPGRVFWSWEERAQGRCSQQTLSCAGSWEVI